MKLNKFSILDKCAKIATISTCILNANDNRDKSETQIQLTDDSLIETIYHYSVYDSPDVTKPLDVHSFEINFYRNGEFIDQMSFGTYGDAYTSGSLCDKNKNLHRCYIFRKLNNEFNNIICNSNNIKNKA